MGQISATRQLSANATRHSRQAMHGNLLLKEMRLRSTSCGVSIVGRVCYWGREDRRATMPVSSSGTCVMLFGRSTMAL